MKNNVFETDNYYIFPFKYGLIRASKNDSFIVPSLMMYGEWTEGEIDTMKKYIKHGDVVLDIGSNWGTHTLAFAHYVGEDGFVHSFDACSVFTDSILFNLEMNEVYNVEVHNCALGNENKKDYIEVHVPDLSQRQNYGEFKINGTKMKDATTFQMKTTGQIEHVDMCTIDSFNFDRVDMIKIDVEGLEFDVLKGAEKTIQKFNPYLFIEAYRHDNDPMRNNIISYLKKYDYIIEDCDVPFFNPDNINKENQNIFVNCGVSENIFAIHKSKKV